VAGPSDSAEKWPGWRRVDLYYFSPRAPLSPTFAQQAAFFLMAIALFELGAYFAA